ncbi:MAG: flippase-like domain-containing protein [Desulfobulbaceae bacterium]|nr:flippase-like domain-containing protein [Desulfobulbaceae bacterium]
MKFRRIAAQPWFRLALLGFFVAGAVWLLRQRPEQLALLARISPREFTVLLLVSLLSFSMTATASWYLLGVLGTGISWSENLALTFLANFLNYFSPGQPGLGAKALYLKRTMNTSYTDVAVLTATNAILMLSVTGVSGLSIVAWLAIRRGLILHELGIVSLTSIALAAVLPVLARVLPPPTDGLGGWRRLVGNGWNGCRRLWSRPRVLATSTLIVLLQYAVSAVSIMLSYALVGKGLDYLPAFLIAAFLSVANLFPVTPNNIGVFELVLATAAQLSGAEFSVGLIAAGILRLYHLLLCVLALPFVSWKLHRH